VTNESLLTFLDYHGLSDKEFANLIGVTRPAVAHWISGKRKVPNTVAKLIRFFNNKPELMREF
jgi:DNA-binding transcriptional regulator YiaG